MRILNKKEFSKTIQSPKGITLIALIITVIVMLILAAVAISAVTGTEGLFKRSQDAADTYKANAEVEKSLLESLINSVEKYNNAGSNSGGNAGGEGGEVVTPEEDTTAPADVTLEATNKTETGFTLSATATDASGVASFKFVVYEGDEEPAEWTTVTATDNVATLEVTGKTTGTEYTCKVKAVDTKGNESDATEIKVTLVEVSRTPLGTEVFTSNKTYDNQATGTYSNPIIPKGFYPVNENGANWGTAEGYKKGLVIEDAVGNQYVWVPVDGTNVKFERYEFGKGTYMTSCSEVLPEALSSSVTLNQGFYIARFEAGVSDAMKAALKNANNGKEVTKLSSDTTATYGTGTYLPVSKQGAIVWDYIKHADGKGNGVPKIASSLYPESSSDYGVVSTLIYGAQWDTALKFIGAYDVGEEGYDRYATNSTGMGNHIGTNGSMATPDVCGASPAFRQKNIYDMAGNVYEWTNEEYNYRPVIRGGFYSSVGSDTPASSRGNIGNGTSSSGYGFRLALYIKTN